MNSERPYSRAAAALRQAGLRATRQRLALARFLLDRGDCHLTAEYLHGEAQRVGIRVSLATIYNTLHQFTRAGILREVVVGPGRSYFDTNTSNHHHFYFEGDGSIVDIPPGSIDFPTAPTVPAGTRISRIDVIVRLEGSFKTQN
ncbi:MAG: Fur family transcriptional regulator [Alphaproteobacteria bacterium]